jgi:hypothetical protein
MKLRYFFPAILAVVTALFTACSDDDDTYLSQIRVSQSSLAFPAEGGSVTISLKTVGDWTISTSDKNGMPDWITISPTTGGAGTTDVTFTATTAKDSREATLFVECAGVKQNLILIQQTEKTEAPLVAIKEVINGEDGQTFRVKGVCVTNPDNEYGNWDIEDETGKVYVYGTCDMKGNKGKGTYPISGANGWGFGVGDIITVEGPRKDYNGTIELVDVTVIAVEKSLIKVDSFDVAVLPIEGGVATAAVTCKGKGISVDIPAEAQSWLSIVGIDTNKGNVKFLASQNNGGDRSAEITFITTDETGKEYTSAATLSQKGSIQEVSVADFLAAEVGDAQFRMTGIVTELYASDKQGESFYIRDYSGQTLVYRAAGFKDSGAKVGDIVTVVGKRGAFQGTAQMTSGTFEELKYAVTEISIAEFLTKPDDPNTYYMVTGIVDKIDNATYGNVYIKDGENSLFSYGCYPGWGATGDARKNCLANKGIEVGDKLTIIGVKGTKNDAPQLSNGIYFSHEKAQPADAPGTEGKPFTVAESLAKCKEIGETSDGVIYFGKGKISSIKEVNTSKGNATFNISDDGTENNIITIWRSKYFGGADFTAEDQIAVGDEVIIKGKLVNYQGTTPEFSGSVEIVSLNGKTE